MHERKPDSSFSTEFRGASDSLIERDQRPDPIGGGGRGGRVLLVIVLLAGVLGGGGYALWYWSEPIGECIASWKIDAPPAAPVEPVVQTNAPP